MASTRQLAARRAFAAGLDGHWGRKFDAGTVSPDFSLDLHGASLDAAYGRLMHGMAQAQATGARVVLLITGKPRPADPARGDPRQDSRLACRQRG